MVGPGSGGAGWGRTARSRRYGPDGNDSRRCRADIPSDPPRHSLAHHTPLSCRPRNHTSPRGRGGDRPRTETTPEGQTNLRGLNRGPGPSVVSRIRNKGRGRPRGQRRLDRVPQWGRTASVGRGPPPADGVQDGQRRDVSSGCSSWVRARDAGWRAGSG